MTFDDIKKIFPDANIIELDAGRDVMCDFCGADYTDRPDSGGFLLSSWGVCPQCAPECERRAILEGEQNAIRARCPHGQSFADWIRSSVRVEDPARRQAEICRDIVCRGVDDMVRNSAREGIPLESFVNDLFDFTNYLVACRLIELSLPRDAIVDAITRRAAPLVDQAIANTKAGDA